MTLENDGERNAYERSERVRRVIMECLHRRNKGEAVSDESLIRKHADLMPELGEDLQLLRLFQSFRSDSVVGGPRRLSPDVGNASSRGLRIRCPHCHRPVEVLIDTPFTEITCSACGSHFSLVGDSARTDNGKSLETHGHLELIERLGVGGFGTVWKARDARLDRTVAVKIPREGQLGPDETEQFLREARAAAQLKHPNIVSVHEVGRQNGQTYIVSDYVQGTTMADRFRDQHAGPQEAAELCAKIAEAMHHAHQKGVIHRDLKPSNIILDAEGEPHVMDFGLAKRDAGEITMTVDGKLLGTPAYMSPEQAQGDAHRADHRADIYSLGAILFELLTGELPFRGNSQMLIQQVIHDEPPSPRKLNGRIPRDLETICLKCLEKERVRRYGSAAELAAELRRYVRGLPIHARRITTPVRAYRWCKRNRLAATTAALLAVLAIAGPIVAARQAALRHQADTLAIEERKARSETHRNLYVADMRLVQHAWHAGNVRLVRRLLGRHAQSGLHESDLRGFEWYHYWQRAHDVKEVPTLNHEAAVVDVAYSPDGMMLATASGTAIHLWDLHTRQPIRVLDGREEAVTRLAFSPVDGSLLASASGHRIVFWNIAEGGSEEPLGAQANRVTSLGFSPDGSLLAFGAAKTLTVWSTNSRRSVADFKLRADRAFHTESLAFSPDGRLLATANVKASVSVFDIVARQQLDTLLVDIGHNNAVAFSPDGRILASAGNDALIRLWDTATWQENASFPGHLAPILAMKFFPDGTLATGGQDRTIKLWDVDSRTLKTTLRGHTSHVSALAISPSGDALASASSDGSVMLWSVADDFARDTLGGNRAVVHSVTVSPDSNKLASASYDGTLKLWDLTSHSVIRSEKIPGTLWCLAYAPDGKTLALGTPVGPVLWNVASWSEVHRFPGQKNVMSVTFSPDGKILAAGNWPKDGGTVVLWNLQARPAPLAIIHDFSSWYGGLAFSPDGKTLAVPKSDNNIELWDIDSQKSVANLTGHSKTVKAVDFSPDGQTLASASEDTIFLWNLATGSSLTRLEPDQAAVQWLAFSPDGTTLASSGHDGTVKLWNTALCKEVGALVGHVGPVGGIAFSQDGRLLASAGWDRTIRLWRAATRVDVARQSR